MAVDPNKLADAVMEAATAAIARLFAAKEAELDARFEKRLSELPVPKDGKDGADGQDGASVDAVAVTKEVMEMVATFLDDVPIPKDGADGKDGINGKDAEVNADEIVDRVLALVPKPKDGENGKDGADGVSPELDLVDIAKRAADLIEVPKDGINGKDGTDGVNGKDADPSVIKAEVERVFSTIPVPADGRDGLNGKDGSAGRDAIHLEIIPAIDQAKAYPRNTFAKHENGLWRSFEKTDGMKGWECLVAGVASLEMLHDGERGFTFKAVLSDGTKSELEASPAIPLDKGVFREGSSYAKGDGCTWGGSFWIAQKDTNLKPPGGDDWRLAVKCGRDGRSPYDIARQNGFSGTEPEWLNTLRGRDGKDKT